MSAFMVDKTHIDVMISAGLRGPHGLPIGPDNAWHGVRWYAPGEYGEEDIRMQLDYTTADEVGAMLVATSLVSIQARYPDTIEQPEGTPGPIERYWEQAYTWTDPRCRVSAVEALKALACYEYQSCEHEGWHRSEAKEFCDALRHALIGRLPGMNDAPWNWSAKDVAQHRGQLVTS